MIGQKQPHRAFAATLSGGGYTLIELLVVMVIMGIAAGLIVPSFSNLGSISAEGAGRAIVSDLMFSQNEAISRQSIRTVVFNKDANQYELRDQSGTALNAPWMNGRYRIDFANDRRFSGVRIESVDFGGTSSISFDDLGAPTSGGTIEISGGNRRFRVTVTAFTGRVTITEVAPVAAEGAEAVVIEGGEGP